MNAKIRKAYFIFLLGQLGLVEYTTYIRLYNELTVYQIGHHNIPIILDVTL